MRLSLLLILIIGAMGTAIVAQAKPTLDPKGQAKLMFQSCLNGVEASLKAQEQTQDLDNLMAFHEKAKTACHCMAYDPDILKATAQLASLQKKGKTAPFALSEAYQTLLMKTKTRCFSNRDKKI